jgi:hypothetical protein
VCPWRDIVQIFVPQFWQLRERERCNGHYCLQDIKAKSQ